MTDGNKGSRSETPDRQLYLFCISAGPLAGATGIQAAEDG